METALNKIKQIVCFLFWNLALFYSYITNSILLPYIIWWEKIIKWLCWLKFYMSETEVLKLPLCSRMIYQKAYRLSTTCRGKPIVRASCTNTRSLSWHHSPAYPAFAGGSLLNKGPLHQILTELKGILNMLSSASDLVAQWFSEETFYFVCRMKIRSRMTQYGKVR